MATTTDFGLTILKSSDIDLNETLMFLALAGCGGGDDSSPPPAPPPIPQPEPVPPLAQYTATLIAGGDSSVSTCVDGPAVGANLLSGPSFTGGHGKYWLAQVEQAGVAIHVFATLTQMPTL